MTAQMIKLFCLLTWIILLPQIPLKKSIDITNPQWLYVVISWFAYDSDANKAANIRYKWTSGNVDGVIETFMWEAMFNMNAIWHNWELWMCQLLPRYNKQFINDPKRKTFTWQAELCLQKRLLVSKNNKWKIRTAYNIRHLQKNKIIYLK